MQQRTFDGEGHRECEQPLPSALGSVISGLGGSNEPELVSEAGGVFPTTTGEATVFYLKPAEPGQFSPSAG